MLHRWNRIWSSNFTAVKIHTPFVRLRKAPRFFRGAFLYGHLCYHGSAQFRINDR